MGSAAANIQINYLGAQGNVVASESCPGACPAIPPGGGWTFIESRTARLPKGFIGSAVITSDQPIAVLLAKDVDGGDGYYETAGDTVSVNAGSGKLFLPLVINQGRRGQDWDSRFAIQNMGSTTACATLVYTSNDSDAEVYCPFNPAAGGTPQDGCPQGGIPIAAGGTLFRSYQTMGVGPNFTGSVRVDLYPNAQGTPPSQQFVVATTDVFNIDSHQFAGYSGFTSSDMGTSLLLPLIERTAGGEWSTDFEIMNCDPGTAGERDAEDHRARRQQPAGHQDQQLRRSGLAAVLPGQRRRELPGARRHAAAELPRRHGAGHVRQAGRRRRVALFEPQRRLHQLPRPADRHGGQEASTCRSSTRTRRTGPVAPG